MMTISSTHAEMEQIFIKLELAEAKTICITSDKPRSGSTSLASALTERYMLAGYKTLLVDFNLFNPSFSDMTLNHTTNNEPLVLREDTQQVFSGIAAPTILSDQLAYRDPTNLRHNIKQWTHHFDRIVFDTCALSQTNQSNIPTAVVAHVTDASVLVVAGGQTTGEELNNAVAQLKATNANIVGIVLNQFDQNTLSEELVRVADKGRFLPQSWKVGIKSWLNKSTLFRQAV
ncbi:chromosome partitioning protein ParA [Vibrio agarivorans]|uniref:chromosome partitioning protein ParA n=1 Tax=Vibrio agarivorans TaxID=153622 RepID=UPI0022328481|nr:chromosome partitioning protein ParA [Vibrio agarivorans]